MISVKNPTLCTMLLVMLCYASLAYSQHPAMGNAATAQEENYKRFLSCKRAAEDGNIAPLAAYAKRGGNLNARSGSRGESFLAIAIEHNHEHMVAWLLDNGAEIESGLLDSVAAKSTNEHNRSLTMMKLLLFHGATSDHPTYNVKDLLKGTVKGLNKKVNLLGHLIAGLADTDADTIGAVVIDYDLKKVDEVVEKAKLLIGYDACTNGCLNILTYVDDFLLRQQSEFKKWEESRNTPNFDRVTADYRKAYCRMVEEEANRYDMLRYHCYPLGRLALGSASNHFLRWLARFDKPNPLKFGKPLTMDPGDVHSCFPYFLKEITDYLAKKREAVGEIRTYVTEFPHKRSKFIAKVITEHITKDPAAIVEQYMKAP